MTIEEIHNLLVNEQRRQMVKQINEYGLYDFWANYKEYLRNFYVRADSHFHYFTDAVISYHRITNR